MFQERDFQRLAFPIDVEYAVPSKGDFEGEAKAANISLGGIELQLGERLEIGTRLSLRIHFPRQNRLTVASGELVWVKENRAQGKRGYEAGIRFTQADPFEFEDLLKVVGRYLSWQSNPATPSRPS